MLIFQQSNVKNQSVHNLVVVILEPTNVMKSGL
jgi:hypothetical protein